MRRILKAVAILAVAVLVCAMGLFAWLYFYTRDLPPVSKLSAFRGVSELQAQLHSCAGPDRTIAVVPRERLGRYTLASLVAAEGKPDVRSPFTALFFPHKGQHTVSYQLQLARSLICTRSSELARQFQELRLANAINRKFDQEDLLTIYLNQAYFDQNVYGIEAAAKRYFGKNASALTLEESSMLVSMIRSPHFYSPLLHPERAAKRRNQVLDEMVVEKTVLQSDADRAKAAQIQFLE